MANSFGHLERLRTLAADVLNGERDQEECAEILLDGDDDGYGRLWDACREAAQADNSDDVLDWAAIVLERCLDDVTGVTARRARGLIGLARLIASADMSALPQIDAAWADANLLPLPASTRGWAAVLPADPPAIAHRIAAEPVRPGRALARTAVCLQAWLLLESHPPQRPKAVRVVVEHEDCRLPGRLELAVQPDGPSGLFPDPRTMSLANGNATLARAIDDAWRHAVGNHTPDACLVWSLVTDDDLAWARRLEVKDTSLGAAFADLLADALGPRAVGPPLAEPRPQPRPQPRLQLGVRWLRGHTGEAHSMTFSLDGRTLAVAGTGRIWLFERTGALIRELTGIREQAGHTSWVSSVAFSPDGGTLAGCGGRRVWLWDVGTGALIRELTLDDVPGVASVAFSPNGRILAGGGGSDYGGQIWLWDADTGALIQVQALDSELPPGSRHGVVSVAFSPDGQTLASGGCKPERIRLWSAPRLGLLTERQPQPQPKPQPRLQPGVRRLPWYTGKLMVFSPDGRTLAGSDLYGCELRLWDVSTGTKIRELAWQRGQGTRRGQVGSAVAFSPDGHTLAGGAISDRKIWLRDVGTGAKIGELTWREGAVTSVAFSPDGRTLAAGTWVATDNAIYDGMVRLWDLVSGALIRELTLGDVSGAGSVAFSPDGRVLASGGCALPGNRYALPGTATYDGKVWLWDVATGALVREFTLDGAMRVRSVAFSPDGRILLGGTPDKGKVWLWDVDQEFH